MLPPIEVHVLPVIKPTPHKLKKLKFRSSFSGVGNEADVLRLDLTRPRSREPISAAINDRLSRWGLKSCLVKDIFGNSFT